MFGGVYGPPRVSWIREFVGGLAWGIVFLSLRIHGFLEMLILNCQEKNFNHSNLKVTDLIVADTPKWKRAVIESTFSGSDAANILKIPLSFKAHPDYLVWGCESSGEFSICSSYKILQGQIWDPSAYALQNNSIYFYKFLWNLNILGKVKITLWRFSWNYVPTFANLKVKKLLVDARCPRCAGEDETLPML